MSGGTAPPEDPRRVPGLDVLRGFALFGILLVNALMMAGPYTLFGGGPGAPRSGQVAAWVVNVLVTGKFHVLFAFLFGYSFVLQKRSAEWAGASFAPRHLRRATALLAIGAVHAVLLYTGDILMTYGALALVLYGLRTLTPRAALRLAAVLLAVPSVLLLGYGLLTVALTEPFTLTGPYPPAVTERIAAHRGDAPSVVAVHLRDLRGALGRDVLYAPVHLAAMLAGLAAARSGVAERRGRDRAWLRAVALRWLPAGLAGGVVAACCANGPLDSRWFYVGQAVTVLTAPALTVVYACGVLLLADACRPVVAKVLAAAGRMALSHYLTQSLVLSLVFTGYGLGLYDRAGTVTVVAGCVVLYAVQLGAGSRLMARTRYGPAELLLRGVTSGRGSSGRRSPASTGARPAADGVRPVR
ncbi:DUF418 domain-containing protein [Streptomyces sp. CHD11]|uniref:DUF418 domain-containing protein n=1 Tax=Streptomyces sp. CHD11 TaxID=2741325 RepID=UPI001BFC7677|nr:DUF418 domain-containing protein [Streptomyces sp. CHD11]MBT3154934.1 DUF418 domain-containing protein [Streptomyces sp. CHD11]